MVNSPHSRIVLAHCCVKATPSHPLAHSPARHDEKWNVALSLGTWTIGVADNWFAMTLNPSFVMNKELDNAADDQHFSGDDAFFGYASVGAKMRMRHETSRRTRCSDLDFNHDGLSPSYGDVVTLCGCLLAAIAKQLAFAPPPHRA